MKKQLFAVMALALVASSALAQVVLPGNKRGDLPDVPDIIKKERTIEVLQVGPCVQPFGKDAHLPPGITNAGFCLQGPVAGGTDITVSETPACRFVGNVLCLDPGPNGNFESFLSDCPAGTTAVIQGVKLRKIEPRVAKCPDVFPGFDFTQTGVSGIRTWFPIKFTPCDTIFRLDIEIGCVAPATQNKGTGNRQGVVQVRLNRFDFKVTVRPQTFRWVIEALHCEPLGVCEVPCITDEALFARLLSQADLISTTADAAFGTTGGTVAIDQAKLRDLNDLLDRTESLIVKFCFFTLAAFEVDDKTGELEPCALFGGVLPGNKTIGPFGFGIIDTVENPCCCKLIGDIACIKRNLIGIDP